MSSPTPSGPRRRPRDRRQQIVAAAAELFWQRGFGQVGVVDVAAAVDIGHSALYRHFRSKVDLLIAVVDEALNREEAAFDATDGPEGTLHELVRIGIQSREYVAVWHRDVLEVPREQLGNRSSRRTELVARAGAMAAGAGPDPAGIATLRADAALAVIESAGRHHIKMDVGTDVGLLTGAARAVLEAPLPTDAAALATGREQPSSLLLPAARREALLAVAGRLFAERGYDAVSLNEIGAELGIAGPSIYNHFPGKLDLLTAILQRGNENLWFTLHRVLAESTRPEGAIARLLDNYIEVVGGPPRVVSVLINEVENLPPDLRHSYRVGQRAYLDEWVALLCAWRPSVDERSARLLILATFAAVAALHRDPGRPAPHPDLVYALTAPVLGLPPRSPAV